MAGCVTYTKPDWCPEREPLRIDKPKKWLNKDFFKGWDVDKMRQVWYSLPCDTLNYKSLNPACVSFTPWTGVALNVDGIRSVGSVSEVDGCTVGTKLMLDINTSKNFRAEFVREYNTPGDPSSGHKCGVRIYPGTIIDIKYSEASKGTEYTTYTWPFHPESTEYAGLYGALAKKAGSKNTEALDRYETVKEAETPRRLYAPPAGRRFGDLDPLEIYNNGVYFGIGCIGDYIIYWEPTKTAISWGGPINSAVGNSFTGYVNVVPKDSLPSDFKDRKDGSRIIATIEDDNIKPVDDSPILKISLEGPAASVSTPTKYGFDPIYTITDTDITDESGVKKTQRTISFTVDDGYLWVGINRVAWNSFDLDWVHDPNNTEHTFYPGLPYEVTFEGNYYSGWAVYLEVDMAQSGGVSYPNHKMVRLKVASHIPTIPDGVAEDVISGAKPLIVPLYQISVMGGVPYISRDYRFTPSIVAYS